MLRASIRGAAFALFFCSAAAAQVAFPVGSPLGTVDPIQTGEIDFNAFLLASRNAHVTEVQSPNSAISRLDLKAPRKARNQYEQGYRQMMRGDLSGADESFTKAIGIYPRFVAAHNGLGTVYLKLGKDQQAYDEFSQAIALDGHLPNSYLNLGCAELALKNNAAAEATLRKASSMAPLDVQLKVALEYAEFVNRDYAAVIETARLVHAGKHEGAAIVHFFAAGAWEAQGNFDAAEQQMDTLLREEPQSPSAGQFRQIIEQLKQEEREQEQARLHPVAPPLPMVKAPAGPTPEELARRRQIEVQKKEEEDQIAEAEAAPDPTCMTCSEGSADPAPAAGPAAAEIGEEHRGATLRIDVNETSVLVAVTDHGRAVTDLAAKDLQISDDGKPPSAILGFRNESQLPLRLGLVIDMSDSVADRFSFEQSAATEFLQETAFGKDDLAFVVGVNNLVLLAQDFTANQALTSHALYELAPSGGTALWDAVEFAADKLAGHAESEPVARILVVISDGNDNSSAATLKQAIARAQRGDVAVYTVSTNYGMNENDEAIMGDHALRTLSELTGGAAFNPNSVHELKSSLRALQQVIRSRYLVSYLPDSFQANGQYRSVHVTAEKDGRQLKVFARSGYYASVTPSGPESP